MTPSTWLNRREKGTVLGILLMHWFATALGRGPTRLVARGVALWYVLFHAELVAASREWHEAVHNRPARFVDVYRHVLAFAQVTVDRLFLLRGETSALKFERTGHDHLVEAERAGKGAILLGSHLGSFEALRADGQADFPLQILGHFANAKMVNAVFEKLNPAAAENVIHISVDSVDFIFRVQQWIEKGGFIGTTGDRVGLNEKAVDVTFFGRRARFPTGPFVLASVLKCPVYLTFGLYSSPNRYQLFCEPFAQTVSLPRKNRAVHLQKRVEQYVDRLEHYCRQAPDNWFNFYDFWASTSNEEEAGGGLVNRTSSS